ncbi:hypothetical protein BGZ70_001906 [Mortierella alpina]|uniref:Protein kinase domain-containing protein n=1 Tax=Mortierella alpina TaxID=64518 RepID=A0A9P6IV09_MORAP|nr:hypothetical protein BGZ70_001906 [Mortierella alpina]
MFNWSLSFNTGNIKLGKKIGHGYQAEIFKAKYGRTGLDEVVVKRFLDSTDKSTKQEVAIIQQLTHKNIVQFYHVHHDMIVMEYVEGGNLTDAIKGKALKSWEVKTRIAKDISLGLAYLHSQGIIHCDIKSANILLTEHKEARICDFGLAMRVGEPGGGGGTLQWMAPELLCHPPLHSSKSDVYALGMVMWEMASESTQPYREHTPDGATYCIMHGILEECPDKTPETYAAIVQACWTLDPDKRPAAIDVLPEVVPSPHLKEGPEHQQRITTNNGKMDHYLKALAKTFQTNESARFREIVKDGAMLRGAKTMDWFDSSAGGTESANAMFRMGTMYYSGRGVPLDYGEAMEWYLAASEAGVAVAMFKISQMYQYGHGVDKDDQEAISWYSRGEEAVNEQARTNNRIVHHDASVSEHHARTMEWFLNDTEGESADANRQIGDLYSWGDDLIKDYNRAMQWYLKASDGGNGTAMSRIGFMYDQGHHVDQDYAKAMEWHLKASDTGHATAKRSIGNMYYLGQGLKQDYTKAMEWYLKAIDAGDDVAKRFIGNMYNLGQGVKQDYVKAMEWYLKASDTADSTATGFIGMMYHEGLGAEQDCDKAMEWYLKASDAGNAFAKYSIGSLYVYGQGVEQDYTKAMEWYIKASDAGDATAMRSIGTMYTDGRGVEQDYAKAMKWYLKACDAGDDVAKRLIGTMYTDGRGVEQDYAKAMEWLLKASDAGDDVAKRVIGGTYAKGRGLAQDHDKTGVKMRAAQNFRFLHRPERLYVAQPP